jgi:small subunit ribosomal protein S2
MDAGAHFGHQTQRWNPKMLPYIYGARNGVHILNLDVSLKRWEIARKFIVDKIALGGNLLMVGTKTQAREIIEQEATRCGAHFVSSRWLGGALSNFQTIRNSIERMRRRETLLADASVEGSKVRLSKKEKLDISREVKKLNTNLGGLRNMKRVPDVIFIVDIVKEEIAVAEANRLHIPVIALVDTNADPTKVTFPIPSNDDSTRTIKLFAAAVADAVIEGRSIYRSRFAETAHAGERMANGRHEAAVAAAPTTEAASA